MAERMGRQPTHGDCGRGANPRMAVRKSEGKGMESLEGWWLTGPTWEHRTPLRNKLYFTEGCTTEGWIPHACESPRGGYPVGTLRSPYSSASTEQVRIGFTSGGATQALPSTALEPNPANPTRAEAQAAHSRSYQIREPVQS
jgi:hypothetical protein